MNKPIKEHILKVYGREPETLDELARCVIAVINSQENISVFDKIKNKNIKHCKVLGFAWDIRYSDMVSNSHSSPEGYPQNWGRKEGLPKGYTGWTGRVWIRYAEEPSSFASDPFNKTLTHPGTGGFGSYDGPWKGISSARFMRYGHKSPKDAHPEPKVYSWDYRFYDLDWPLVAQLVGKHKVWEALSGNSWDNRHFFQWTDSDTLIADSAFIAECATHKAKEIAFDN